MAVEGAVQLTLGVHQRLQTPGLAVGPGDLGLAQHAVGEIVDILPAPQPGVGGIGLTAQELDPELLFAQREGALLKVDIPALLASHQIQKGVLGGVHLAQAGGEHLIPVGHIHTVGEKGHRRTRSLGGLRLLLRRSIFSKQRSK